jgi:succinate dehydrogenase / fumarate reductase cytochrome b subunit
VSLDQAFRFYQASIGKKVVMAVTGFILFGYVLGHLIGNLQIYLGREQINSYAEFLHSKPPLLWSARFVLLTAVALHIVTSIQLWLLKRKARPFGYVKEEHVPAGYASRTMLWSGPIIAAFVVYHILHLTTGSAGLPYRELDVYHNVINGFRLPWVSISYIVAMALLCMHLYHGLWSMLQSVGISHPRYTPLLKRFAAVFAIFIAAGNISIPVAVMTGFLGP